jgi:hypothetical protein
MKQFIKDIIKDESNRKKHFIGGIFCGLVFTILFAAGVASGMEFKDYYGGGKWDWRDWFSTVLGGIIGNLVGALWIWAFFNL